MLKLRPGFIRQQLVMILKLHPFVKKLVVSEPLLIRRINANLSTEFHYNMTSLNEMILCKEGIHQYEDNGNTILSFCHGCYSSLNKNKISCFALANRIYRGALSKNIVILLG